MSKRTLEQKSLTKRRWGYFTLTRVSIILANHFVFNFTLLIENPKQKFQKHLNVPQFNELITYLYLTR